MGSTLWQGLIALSEAGRMLLGKHSAGYTSSQGGGRSSAVSYRVLRALAVVVLNRFKRIDCSLKRERGWASH